VGLCARRYCRFAAGHHHRFGPAGSNLILLMRGLKLLSAMVPLALAAGCASRHRESSANYSEPSPPSPTSERTESRIYPEPRGPSSPEAPPPVSSLDIAVGKSISRLLKTDPSVRSISGNVEASIEKGVVTLRGSVPTEHDRLLIAERVSSLPGVDRVDNQLGVDYH
jgi:hypothetical protein